MAHAGHIVAEAVVAAAIIVSAMMPVVVVMVVMIRVVPIRVVVGPIGIPAPITVIGIAPVIVPAPIGAPVRTIAPTDVETRGETPIEGVVAAAHINVGVAAAAACVIVVVIVTRGGGLCAETLDASRIVGIVVGFGGGVDHAVGVGHRFRGLVNGFGIAGVVLAVGIVGLVVVFRVAADAWAHVGAVAGGHATARIAVGRIVGVVFRHLLVRRASGEGHQGNERKDSERFHFIVFLFVLEIIFRRKNMQNSYQNHGF